MATKAQQEYLSEEMTPKRDEELHSLAVQYADLRDRRMKLLEEEVDLKSGLLFLMRNRQLKHYEFDGVVVDRFMTEEKVKVKVTPPKEEEDD